jgi:hypothetical protein
MAPHSWGPMVAKKASGVRQELHYLDGFTECLPIHVVFLDADAFKVVS